MKNLRNFGCFSTNWIDVVILQVNTSGVVQVLRKYAPLLLVHNHFVVQFLPRWCGPRRTAGCMTQKSFVSPSLVSQNLPRSATPSHSRPKGMSANQTFNFTSVAVDCLLSCFSTKDYEVTLNLLCWLRIRVETDLSVTSEHRLVNNGWARVL